MLVFPMLLAYECGIFWLGGAAAETVRSGADAWMRHALASCGLTDQLLLPFVLILTLLMWHILVPEGLKITPAYLVGMTLECVVLAVALIGISRLIDVGFNFLEHPGTRVLAIISRGSQARLLPLVGFLGAGIYEEALFRLMLVPTLFGILRLLQAPIVLANALAVTSSALLFSLAHHAGTPAEAFTWYAFIFRWMAGVFFAWVFVIRGFGIVVGTHTAYDILVGWVGWRL